MAATITIRAILKNGLIGMVALAVVYLAPALAHMTGWPVYMLEPMRLMVILALAHGSRGIALLLAATLPLFSFLVSGHPEFLKMVIITGELLLNVVLFYLLKRKFLKVFPAAAGSVVISKLICYLTYWPVFSYQFMVSEADPFFLAVQIITTLIFSFYLMIILKKIKP